MPAPQYVRRSYGGGAGVAQLVNAIGAGDTTFTIAPVTGWVEEDGSSPLGTSGPFTVVIDRFTPQVEKICCSAINLSTGVVTVYTSGDGWTGRGYDGTEPQAHVPNGSTSGVQTCWSSLEADEANQCVYDILGGGGGGGGSGVPIGGIIPFGGTPSTLPANFLVADGSSVSRVTYASLFTAITIAATGDTTLAGTTINNVSSAITPYLAPGMKLTIANSGGATYTIANAGVHTTSVVVTSGTGITAGTGGALTFFPHGFVDSTHFNLPDARSRVITGNLGTATATNSQPALYVGGTGGESVHTLVAAELAAHTHPYTDPTHGHNSNIAGLQVYVDDPLSTIKFPGGGTYTATLTAPTTSSSHVGITINNNTPAGSSHENKQPYLVATHIIRAS